MQFNSVELPPEKSDKGRHGHSRGPPPPYEDSNKSRRTMSKRDVQKAFNTELNQNNATQPFLHPPNGQHPHQQYPMYTYPQPAQYPPPPQVYPAHSNARPDRDKQMTYPRQRCCSMGNDSRTFRNRMFLIIGGIILVVILIIVIFRMIGIGRSRDFGRFG